MHSHDRLDPLPLAVTGRDAESALLRGVDQQAMDEPDFVGVGQGTRRLTTPRTILIPLPVARRLDDLARRRDKHPHLLALRELAPPAARRHAQPLALEARDEARVRLTNLAGRLGAPLAGLRKLGDRDGEGEDEVSGECMDGRWGLRLEEVRRGRRVGRVGQGRGARWLTAGHGGRGQADR